MRDRAKREAMQAARNVPSVPKATTRARRSGGSGGIKRDDMSGSSSGSGNRKRGEDHRHCLPLLHP